MSDTKTTFQEYTSFELYLEGIKVPFSNITIREVEGSFPSATIQFPGNSGVLRVLGGTIVQIFGPDPTESKNKILLFEGEISTISYAKTDKSRAVGFQAISFLEQWNTVTARPKDSMVTSEWGDALGDYTYEYYNATEKNLENTNPESNKDFRDKTQAGNEEVPDNVFDNLGNLNLTVFSGLVDEISQLVETEEVTVGDLHVFIDFFLKKFEDYDMFYGLCANSLNLRESIFTSPNVGKIEPFKRKALIENFFTLTTEKFSLKNGGTLKLVEAVGEFLRTFHYSIVSPSSYTSSFQFQAGSSESRKPVRSYFLPGMENSPPIKNNLMFPHQITSLSFSRSLLAEPTRTISEVQSVLQNGLTEGPKGFKPFAVQPTLNITQKGATRNTVGLTTEETYRGITPNIINQTPFFVETEKSEIIRETRSFEDSQKEEYQAKIKKPLNELTLNAHHQKRLSTRSLSLSGVYMPYIMSGLPGAYIETDGGPSFTGVVAAKTLIVNSGGSANTSITLKSVRTIHDLSDLVDEDFENAINDFTLDPYIDINDYLYDENLYSFRAIGQNVYPYLRWGTFSKQGDTFKNYADKGIAFSEGKDAVSNIYSNQNVVDTDDSILGVLRNSEGQIVNSIATDLTGESNKTLRNSGAYTRDIYEAIYKYANIYKNLPENGQAIKEWTNEQTARNIISKNDYFRSIGVDPNTEISSPVNYKDAIKLFKGTDAALAIKDAVKQSQGQTTAVLLEGDDQDALKARLNIVARRIQNLEKALDVAKIAFNQGSFNAALIELGVTNVTGNRENTQKEINDAETTLNELQSNAEKLRDKINNVNEDEIDFALEFDKEVFKPYNLTRKAHVNLAFRKKVIEAILQELNREDVLGNNNLTILE